VKTLTKQLTQTWLPGLLLGASLMISAPSHGAEAQTVQQPAAPTQTAEPVVHVAWDRVGSPVRSFV